MADYGGGFLKTIRHPRSSVMAAGFAMVAAASFDAALTVASVTQSQVEGYQYPARTVRHTQPQPIIWNWAPVEVTPGSATLTTTRYAPTVATPREVTPGSASLTATTYAPTVATPVEVVPSSASLTTTRYAPTVAATAHVNLVPSSASLTATTYAPTVSTAVEVSPGSASLSITPYAPTVEVTTSFDAATFQNVQGVRTPKRTALFYRYPLLTAGFSTSGTGVDPYATEKFQNIASFRVPHKKRYDPRLEYHKFSFGLLDARPLVPVFEQLASSFLVEARFRTIPLIQEQTGWRTSTTVEPSTASLTLTRFAPTVTATANVNATPVVASLTLTTFAPTVSAPRNVTPGAASLTLTTFATTVATPRNVTPGPASLTLTTFDPTVTAGAAADVTPGPASLVLTTFQPMVEVSIDDVPVVVIGGDDAPSRKKPKTRKERRDLFREIESTIHALLHPAPEVEERAEVSEPAEIGAARRAVDELLVLAKGQRDLLQRAAALRAELRELEAARNRMLEQDEEEALEWMF